MGRRGQVLTLDDVPDGTVRNGPAYLLFPAFTDVRDLNCVQVENDIVEVPSGSGRWYGVLLVDDVGKGFSNEHRYAAVAKISERQNATDFPGLFWPTPIP
jgi:hypothetical protein